MGSMGSAVTALQPATPLHLALQTSGVWCILPPALFLFAPSMYQSVTQYDGDDTVITRAIGGEDSTAEEFVYEFFGGEYKYSNRWWVSVRPARPAAMGGEYRNIP